MFKIETGYYLELLTPKIMKLLGSTKSKITKNENRENKPGLGITEVVLIHRKVVNNRYQQNLKSKKVKKWQDIQFNKEIEYLQNAIDFCLSLKIWGKILVKISQNWNSKYSQRFLDHSKQMRLKPLQKESFKKQRKQPAI